MGFKARARDFVDVHYPRAVAAFLGGSAATGDATESSDLDILVVLPDEWADVSFVETTRHQGQLVEAFVYGSTALRPWLDKGRDERRPVLDRLIGEGLALTTGDLTDSLAQQSRALLAAGPGAADPAQLRLQAYRLSSVVDDLEDAADPGERFVVAATAWREAAELALLADQHWLGTGKWLLRELRQSGDRFGLASWAESDHVEIARLASLCRDVLQAQGGYLQTGFIRGTRPPGH